MDGGRLADSLSGAVLNVFSPECVHFQPGGRPSCMQVCDPVDCLLLGRAHVSVIFFCCDETSRPKHFLKEESVYLTHTPSPCSQQVKAGTEAGRNLEAGAEAEAMEECCLAECPCGLLSVFSPISSNHLPRDDSANMAGFSHICHQSRKCPTDLPPGQCYGSIFPIQVPYSQMTYLCLADTEANRK